MPCLFRTGLYSSGCWLETTFVCTPMGAESYKIPDVLITISGQCRVWHDETKCVTTIILPGRERDVRRRVCVHDGILCPASLSICFSSVIYPSRNARRIIAYRRRPRSTRRRYVLRIASWSRGRLFSCRSSEMVCTDSFTVHKRQTRETIYGWPYQPRYGAACSRPRAAVSSPLCRDPTSFEGLEWSFVMANHR